MRAADADVTDFASDPAPSPKTNGEPTRCLNCGAVVDGNFCGNCGQTVDVQRLTLTVFLKKLVRKALDVDSPYVRTLIGMVRRPGRLISAYVSGQRKPYANPLKFLILTITFTTLVRWGTAEVGLWSLNPVQDPEGAAIENHRLIAYPFVQFLLAGILTLLFYRSRRNFAENIAFSLFVGGTAFVYMSIVEFGGFFVPEENDFWVDGVLIPFVFFSHIAQAAAGFYDQRLLLVVPKAYLAGALALFVLGVILSLLPL
jgi:hypothetical protein